MPKSKIIFRIIFRDSKWGILSALIDGSDLRELNDDTDAFATTVDINAGNLYWVQKNMVRVATIYITSKLFKY